MVFPLLIIWMHFPPNLYGCFDLKPGRYLPLYLFSFDRISIVFSWFIHSVDVLGSFASKSHVHNSEPASSAVLLYFASGREASTSTKNNTARNRLNFTNIARWLLRASASFTLPRSVNQTSFSHLCQTSVWLSALKFPVLIGWAEVILILRASLVLPMKLDFILNTEILVGFLL